MIEDTPFIPSVEDFELNHRDSLNESYSALIKSYHKRNKKVDITYEKFVIFVHSLNY